MLCILIIIDGCNEDYINEKTTPFLYSLKYRSSYISMEVTPSFATRVELFTGNSPKTTDTFVDFCLGPNILPFQVLRVLKPPNKLDTSYNHVPILTVLYFVFTGIWIDFANIPLSLLPHFCINESIKKNKKAEKRGVPDNLMGILKSNGFKVNFIYGNTKTINSKVMRYAASDKEVIILHYGETDQIGHQYGPYSLEMQEALSLIDESVKNVYELFKSKLDLIMIFGDHNMVEITDSVNLWEKLQQLDVKLIKDYLVFLNSPLARFWFENKVAEQKINTLLESLHKYARVVTKEELRQKRLPVDNKYGELIFWANKGINFSPDFYHSAEIKGMHGYFDDFAFTPLIIWNKDRKVLLQKRCKMQDVTPTILNFFGLDYSGMDGKSLLIKNWS